MKNRTNHRLFLEMRRGFTLVELLVSSAIFSSILIISIGSLFTAQAVNSRLQESQVILEGVNLASEVIARDLRYSSDIHCDNTAVPEATHDISGLVYITEGAQGPASIRYSDRLHCPFPTGGDVVVFKPISPLVGTTNAAFDRISYYLKVSTLPNNATSGSIIRREFPSGGTSREYQITPTDVNITQFSVFAKGVNTALGASDVGGATDFNQPLVSFSVSGITMPVDPKTEPVPFSLQTSVSPRGLDN